MEVSQLQLAIIAAMPKLRNISRRMVVSFRFGDEKDLLQDCILRMLLSADTFDESKGDVCVMAYAVMCNLQITEYNRRKMSRTVFVPEFALQVPVDVLNAIIADDLLSGCSHEARLCFYGYTLDEISKMKGCSRGTVANRIKSSVSYLMAETGYQGAVDRRRGCDRYGARKH